MRWLKHFFWFFDGSRDFMGYTTFQVINNGGIRKSIQHANFMCKWDKLTPEQREAWYLNNDRNIEI